MSFLPRQALPHSAPGGGGCKPRGRPSALPGMRFPKGRQTPLPMAALRVCLWPLPRPIPGGSRHKRIEGFPHRSRLVFRPRATLPGPRTTSFGPSGTTGRGAKALEPHCHVLHRHHVLQRRHGCSSATCRPRNDFLAAKFEPEILKSALGPAQPDALKPFSAPKPGSVTTCLRAFPAMSGQRSETVKWNRYVWHCEWSIANGPTRCQRAM